MANTIVNKKRMVSVAIAVSDAKPLPNLPAAINCAGLFHRWAQNHGYESKLITDEDLSDAGTGAIRKNPVTVDRLRTELKAIVDDKRPIDRMLVYFAGHGLTREVENGLWFLSDWKDTSVVVAYELLRRRLASYGIKQIAVFSDACRSLPKTVADLAHTQDGVIVFGGVGDATPQIDKFLAALPGEETSAVPGSTESEDICIFSGVLLEALSGLKQEAFSQLEKNCITSSSLATFLENEVPKKAQTYGLKLKPENQAAFREGENIYHTADDGPARPNPPFAWPLQKPLVAWPVQKPVGLDDVGGEGNREIPPRKPREPRAAGLGVRKPRPQSLVNRMRKQRLPRGFETGSGFAVDGADIKCLWTPKSVLAEPHFEPNWWRVKSTISNRLTEPAPLLIEFVDGRFAAVSTIPNFIAGLVCDASGVSAVVYRPNHSDVGAQATQDVIAALERGGIRAHQATSLAASLRTQKHVDPMLGVFAAYLYDSIGDVDSIRRMAYYYVTHQQPIPYDIALLALVPAQRINDQLRVQVPAVAEGKPRSAQEVKYAWTYEATPLVEGFVGGKWPWLRQGWFFLEDPYDIEAALVRPGLARFAKLLTRSRFPTLENHDGHDLAKLFDLVPRRPGGFHALRTVPASDPVIG